MTPTTTSTTTPTSPAERPDVNHLMKDAQALLAAAIKDGAARVAAAMQPAAGDEGLALVARISQDLNDAKIVYAARTPDEQREDVRFICDTLLLFRACARTTCRKARTCRGRPEQCRARMNVPQPVEDYAAARLLRHLMPWLPTRGSAAQRQAYACWIAGLEAGAGRRKDGASPLPFGERGSA